MDAAENQIIVYQPDGVMKVDVLSLVLRCQS